MSILNSEVKRVQPRYISIDEDIYDALDPYSLKVYMVLRYEGDYSKECSGVKKSVAFLMESSKVKRRQFFKSLNILESLGLIKREDKLGDVSNYLVARTLGYFNTLPVQDMQGVVHTVHTGVHQVHTDHKSLQEYKHNNNISDLKSPETAEVIEEIVSVYHEELPECPKIKKIGSKQSELYKLLVKLMKNWPEYSESKSAFTVEAFRGYLRFIKQQHPGFLDPYSTEQGNIRRNNLKTLVREDNILRFINNEFCFKKG